MFGAYPFVRCDRCEGVCYAGGLTPRKQTRREFDEALRTKKKVQAVCVQCGCIAVLRVIEKEAQNG